MNTLQVRRRRCPPRRGSDGDTKTPNAERAVIAPEKLTGYLLNTAHRRGASKAKLLQSYGYTTNDWQRLEGDLRIQHLNVDVANVRDTDYERRFEIIAPLTTPSGRLILFRSVWQIDIGTECPRLITVYPE